MDILSAARMFPSLAAVLEHSDKVEIFGHDFLRSQLVGNGGSGRKAAASFLLSVFGTAPVDMHHAWSVWDKAHREAAINVLRAMA